MSLLAAALALAALSAGCSPQRTLQYEDNEALAEIPERHQEQVRQYLREYFGTPENPLLRIPAEEQDESSDTVVLVDEVDRDQLRHGAEVYRLRCAGCHGVTGNGQGEVYAYLDPKPRDYRPGIFKFKGTEYGAKPRRADLERVLRVGAKGTSMPAFRWLSEEDLDAVIDYVIHLSRRGEMELALIRESEIELDEEDDYDPFIVGDYALDIDASWEEASQQVVRPVVPEPPYSKETVLAGAKLFVGGECQQCHGRNGRGGKENYSAAGTAKDAWGNVAYAADLTSGMLHGGRRPVDVYRRIYSGIYGSPMSGFGKSPPYSDNPEMIWHLVHFVLSLVQGDEFPEVRAIIEGEQTVVPPTEIAEEDQPSAGGETDKPAAEEQPEPEGQAEKPAAEGEKPEPEPESESGDAESGKPAEPPAEETEKAKPDGDSEPAEKPQESENSPADSAEEKPPASEDKPASENTPASEDTPASENSPASDEPTDEPDTPSAEGEKPEAESDTKQSENPAEPPAPEADGEAAKDSEPEDGEKDGESAKDGEAEDGNDSADAE